MGKSVMIKVATAATCVGGLALLVAFVSPEWLKRDPATADTNRFERLGLWEVCFDGFEHPKWQYDRKFYGCNWILHRQYDIIKQFLLPTWFRTVQGLMTIGIMLVLPCVPIALCLLFDVLYDTRGFWLFIITVLMVLSTLCDTIACLIFGDLADDRDWMQSPRWNLFGYSFGLACFGCVLQVVASVIYCVQTFRLWQNIQTIEEPNYDMKF